MKTIWVESSQGRYPIFVGEKLLAKTGSFLKSLGFQGKGMIVTQKRPARFYLQKVVRSLKAQGIEAHVHFLPEGEKAKSGKELFRLYGALVRNHFERRDFVLALGGGVVGDLAGFTAATYLRGIPFVNIGTTLLAQVDSSIGGKTGINLAEGKNLAGAFYPPRAVICDIETLKTLPGRELRASMAEVIKYGIIHSAKLFDLLEKQSGKLLAGNHALLVKVVAACAAIKAQVVSRDERETKGERMILNYGHTFGHGFEQALGYKKLVHGEAVAIGMICAARLAVLLKLFSARETQRQWEVIRNFGLPVSLAGLNLRAGDILSAMMRDKKRKAGQLRFVLPTRIGQVLVKENIPLSLIREVILEAGGKS